MIQHPWHEVSPAFDPINGHVDGIIEIPRGSKAKYEVDKPSGLIRLDRVIFSAFQYPINYGFIPRTLGKDGDPLDILIWSEVAIQPLCLVRARVIGYLQMKDTGIEDEKILAVAEGDKSVEHIKTMEDFPENFKSEIKHFFTHYKDLINREVIIDQFLPAPEAIEVIGTCLNRYSEKYALL